MDQLRRGVEYRNQQVLQDSITGCPLMAMKVLCFQDNKPFPTEICINYTTGVAEFKALLGSHTRPGKDKGHIACRYLGSKAKHMLGTFIVIGLTGFRHVDVICSGELSTFGG
jgi:hypothetical protein